jgi:hypothetical protein
MCRHSGPPSQGWRTFLATMPTALRRSTFLSFQRSRSGSSIVWPRLSPPY